MSGKVAQRLVQNGDRVRKGQPLLPLDTNDLELQFEQAEAEVRAATTSLTQAEADEERTTTLQKDGWSRRPRSTRLVPPRPKRADG